MPRRFFTPALDVSFCLQARSILFMMKGFGYHAYEVIFFPRLTGPACLCVCVCSSFVSSCIQPGGLRALFTVCRASIYSVHNLF